MNAGQKKQTKQNNNNNNDNNKQTTTATISFVLKQSGSPTDKHLPGPSWLGKQNLLKWQDVEEMISQTLVLGGQSSLAGVVRL